MTSKCKECKHQKVCKFTIKYRETVDSLTTTIPIPFELELKCPHFEADPPWGYGTSINSIPCNNDLNTITYYNTSHLETEGTSSLN